MTMRRIARLILPAVTVSALALASAIGSTRADTADLGRGLKSPAEIVPTGDPASRSRALFTEAAKVLTDPRCMNCHPADRQPTQGDAMRPHAPFMQAGESGFGQPGLNCNSCHRTENTTLVGSRIGSVPGATPWLLAPASMAWQGLTLGGICQQLKDPARNGGRSLAQIHTHLAEDHLVAWAWHPGEGRRPAPGTQAAFGALIAAWIETGAECPP
ncbi:MULTISPECIES: hypothetical protein [Azospirillum]|uniref:Cytochrome c domain-containing protein n=2 Tax=Azospirillum brasilense TaxID=192 RepID=A0ABU4PE18_AZOBR|nr:MULTISPECIES: hypothetical protein [Azospirillum]ALJ39369.1 Isoquinoline 1-oxidoreductase subunit [Azospirillum brasilense]MDX5955850.1 hypothetical protein [Azospirillum brasilense]PWC87395.1 Isoquinoline 1-oxidoreductase subunit [Azospirillum sp. Sp 7]